MTWHLKDRELEKKLIAIDCEFLDNLNDAVKEKIEEFSSDLIEEGDLITLMFCRDHQIELGELYFLFHELEEVPEYNPKIWNDSRKVKPPENVIFMAKVYRTSLCEQTGVYYKALIYKDSKWYYVINGKPSGTQIYLYEDDYVEFKSWED